MKFVDDPITDLVFAHITWEWETPARFVVIAERRQWNDHICESLIDGFGPAAIAVRRSAGSEQITLNDGATIRLVSPQSLIGLRGMTVDVVWLADIPAREMVDDALLAACMSQMQTVPPPEDRIWW